MPAAAAPVAPLDPRVALLAAAHDRTHRDLATLTEEVRKNHDELNNRISLLDTKTEFVGARVTAEVGLINRKLDDIERNGAMVKDHVILMTGKFGELDKKVTLLDERLTARLDSMDEKFTTRLDAMDEKFTTRLDAVDERLDSVDARFEAMDARFDSVDARFEAVDARFDAVDKRFDAVDERFDAADKRFDGIDTRLDTIVELLTTGPRE